MAKVKTLVALVASVTTRKALVALAGSLGSCCALFLCEEQERV